MLTRSTAESPRAILPNIAALPTMARMVDFTLVYGMRLYHGPATEIEKISPMHVQVRGVERELQVTAHVIEGATREAIKQQLLRSIDAFFELH